MTGALQNYARKYQIAIDTLEMDFEVVHDEENAKPQEDGINVIGMWLEGAKWDHSTRYIGESDEKVLFSKAPMVWFKPALKTELNTEGIYECPLYKTTDRRGVLMTTGHSTNFVLLVSLPTDVPQAHWIKRGVAMVCAQKD